MSNAVGGRRAAEQGGDSPKVVVVAAPKGGVGKSTLTMGLLVSARQAGYVAVGVGMDPQNSLQRWSSFREQQRSTPQGADLVEVPVTSLNVHDYRRLRAMTVCDLVVVDTLPGVGEAINSVISLCELADLVLIPTSSSPMDVDQVVPFRKNVAGNKSWFVLNSANRRTRSFQKAKFGMQAAGRVCPIEIPKLEAIPDQFLRGLTVSDKGEAGCEDFGALWNFVRYELGLAGRSQAA
jgi:chromosome partitioning protein